MRKTILFIAMSLDGYIADEAGSVDWLSGQSAEEEGGDSYAEFIKGIDTVIMGWNTYHQVTTELSPDLWPYEGMLTYVLTHRKAEHPEAVSFTEEAPEKLLERLRAEEGKDIWICGGAKTAQALIRAKQIDRYFISVIPTILGGGIRLFEESGEEQKLRLVRTYSYNGITDLVYERRENGTE